MLSLTPDQIRTLLDDLGDLVSALKDAEPDHKFEVYRARQLKLIYEPETETVRAYVDLDQHRGVAAVRRHPAGLSHGRRQIASPVRIKREPAHHLQRRGGLAGVGGDGRIRCPGAAARLRRRAGVRRRRRAESCGVCGSSILQHPRRQRRPRLATSTEVDDVGRGQASRPALVGGSIRVAFTPGGCDRGSCGVAHARPLGKRL